MRVTDEQARAAMEAYYAAFRFGKQDGIYYSEEERLEAMRSAIEAALSHAAGQEATTNPAEIGRKSVGGEAVAWRDEDFVLMPRSLSPASLERMAHFDFDDVGNSYADAADELWGELIDNEAKAIPELEFSNPVFHAGNNTTVRRGTKWYGVEYARLKLGGETVIVRLSAMTQRFCYLTDHYVRDEHDPSCRTVAGLLAEMQRVYPGFDEYEEVTLVNFALPEYTTVQPPASAEVVDLLRRTVQSLRYVHDESCTAGVLRKDIERYLASSGRKGGAT